MLWRIFQLIVAAAGGSLVIWIGTKPDGKLMPGTMMFAGLFGTFCAFGVTCMICDGIDLYRKLSAFLSRHTGRLQ